MPRRQTARLFPGYAPGSGLALRIYWAKGRNKGIAQNLKGTSTAGHSHRHTSGGKAEAAQTGTFRAGLKVSSKYDPRNYMKQHEKKVRANSCCLVDRSKINSIWARVFVSTTR
jgi:hypothetical protein